MTQKILITGASGGFGKLIVHSLLKNGHRVVATMRDLAGRNKSVASELTAAGAFVINVDVTNTDSVNKGVADATAQLGGLDVLINNAGVGVLGMQEFFTAEDYQRIFDINVFGVQRMVRAVAPLMRKQNRGLILYTSSLLGRIALPFYGPYQSAKWALEAMAENYRVELSQFGIENCVVEPGGYPTTFIDNLVRPGDTSRSGEYGEFIGFPARMLENFENVLKNNPQQDPQRVADAIADLIAKSHGERPFRTTVDFIGMGEHVNKYNDHLDQLMAGLYANFGIDSLRRVKR